MAELRIRLEVDPKTGKKNLIIGYESDSDALPMEHEEEHRRLIGELIEGGIVKAEELGEVTVERETPQAAADEAAESEPQEAESISQGQ